MKFPDRARKRAAALTLEAAFVLPATFALLFGILLGGVMVFKYQEVAHLAHETARYAAVHGSQYYRQNSALIQAGTLPNVSNAYLTTYAQGKAVTIPANQLNVTVQVLALPGTATTNTGGVAVPWDTNNSTYSSYTDKNNITYQVGNTVSVTVYTDWNPGVPLLGTVRLSSTSTMPMSY